MPAAAPAPHLQARPAEDTSTTSVRLPLSVLKSMREEAKRQNVTVSSLVAVAITEYIKANR